jgi:hypothetical protein
MLKIKLVSFILAILMMSSLAGYVVFAWVEPGESPPGGNVSAPLNVSSQDQTKAGGLTLNTATINTYLGVGGVYSTAYRIRAYPGAAYGVFAYGSTMGGRFEDSDGTARIYLAYSNYGIYQSLGARNYFKDSVGIGVTSPTQALHVAGNMRLTGHFYDINNTTGSTGQVLTRTASGPAWQAAAGGGITGSGSTNYVPLWTGSASLGNSAIRQTGSNISVGGTPSTSYKILAHAGASYGIRADGSTMGGYFYNTNGTSYAYLAYSSYGIYTNTAYFTGNISAPSNTRENCAWTSWTCASSQTCSNPKWLAGVERGTTLSLCGSGSTRWYQMRLYCCNL